jgi:(2Fe-2S) ferredoxin
VSFSAFSIAPTFRPSSPEWVGGDGALGIGLQLDKKLAGRFVGGWREIEFRHDIGQGLAGHAGGKDPAADRTGQRIADHGRQQVFQIVRTETNAVVVQCVPQRRQLRRARRAGPVMVIYPEGIWYRPATAEDVDEIFEQHVKQGKLVERLVMVFAK